MRIRRSLPVVLSVILVGAAVSFIVVLRKHAPPEPARLLPGADGFLYINLEGLRRTNLGAQLPPVSHDPEYEQFIQATGFQFERDLDEAAFAVHYPTNPSGLKSKAPAETRYSEVFVGKIEGERLRGYVRKISSSFENYRSTDIYTVRVEGRTLRVAILGVDTVAASNHEDPAVIHGIVDRSRKLASPFAGPALLRKYYKRVPFASRYLPFASLAWTIFRADPQTQGQPPAALDFSVLFTQPAVVVASIRDFGGVQFQAEAFTDSETIAREVAERLRTFLTIFFSAQASSGSKPADPDVKALFDSLKVQQKGERAVLTATVPTGFVRKALSAPTQIASPTAQSPTAPPSSPNQKQ
jgi:hypothetical protein